MPARLTSHVGMCQTLIQTRLHHCCISNHPEGQPGLVAETQVPSPDFKEGCKRAPNACTQGGAPCVVIHAYTNEPKICRFLPSRCCVSLGVGVNSRLLAVFVKDWEGDGGFYFCVCFCHICRIGSKREENEPVPAQYKCSHISSTFGHFLSAGPFMDRILYISKCGKWLRSTHCLRMGLTARRPSGCL